MTAVPGIPHMLTGGKGKTISHSGGANQSFSAFGACTTDTAANENGLTKTGSIDNPSSCLPGFPLVCTLSFSTNSQNPTLTFQGNAVTALAAYGHCLVNGTSYILQAGSLLSGGDTRAAITTVANVFSGDVTVELAP